MYNISKNYIELVTIIKQAPKIKEFLEEIRLGTTICFSFDGEKNYSTEYITIKKLEELKRAKELIQNYEDDGASSGVLGYKIIGQPLTREIMEMFFGEIYKLTSSEEFIKNAGYSNREDLIETTIKFEYDFEQGKIALYSNDDFIVLLEGGFKQFWQEDNIVFEAISNFLKEKDFFNLTLK